MTSYLSYIFGSLLLWGNYIRSGFTTATKVFPVISFINIISTDTTLPSVPLAPIPSQHSFIDLFPNYENSVIYTNYIQQTQKWMYLYRIHLSRLYNLQTPSQHQVKITITHSYNFFIGSTCSYKGANDNARNYIKKISSRTIMWD